MASIIDICNQALYDLGDSSISSLTQDDRKARLCNGKYGFVRDAVLRSYPWNCAIKRDELAREADAPDWEYTYKYALPGDCLRVLRMKEEDDNGYAWKVEGRAVLTDATTCSIRYIYRCTVVNNYDALLCSALAARLAAEIAYPLTQSNTLLKAMWDLYRLKIAEARSADAQEGTPDTVMEDTWLDARE